MGYRHITKNEFKYIKDLLKKYKKYAEVAKISGRAIITIDKIAKFDNFKDYSNIKKEKHTSEHKNNNEFEKKQQSVSNIDRMLLQELTSIRKGIFCLNSTIVRYNMSLNRRNIDNVVKQFTLSLLFVLLFIFLFFLKG